MDSIRLFIRLTRPLFLLGGVLLYTLGLGIARYLGIAIDWNLAILGLAWVSLLQVSTHYLNEYYNAPEDQANPNRTLLTGGSGALGPGKLPRRVALYAALTCLAILASLTVLLIARRLPPSAMAIMGLAFLGAFFYSTPPVSLERTGYGELITTILVAYLLPAFAFTLQAGEVHRLVAMAAFPLAALHLAMLLTFELPDYATDMKYEKRTLLVRLGWQSGMTLHNLLIISGFLILGLALIYGLPGFAGLPAFLALPLGGFQIWQINRIRAGAKPNWTAITVGGLALFASMAYLLAFAFWTH